MIYAIYAIQGVIIWKEDTLLCSLKEINGNINHSILLKPGSNLKRADFLSVMSSVGPKWRFQQLQWSGFDIFSTESTALLHREADPLGIHECIIQKTMPFMSI